MGRDVRSVRRQHSPRQLRDCRFQGGCGRLERTTEAIIETIGQETTIEFNTHWQTARS